MSAHQAERVVDRNQYFTRLPTWVFVVAVAMPSVIDPTMAVPAFVAWFLAQDRWW